ncbi:MAG: HAMP domain-containing sensor histidine kinase [Planctomycetota bacterium]
MQLASGKAGKPAARMPILAGYYVQIIDVDGHPLFQSKNLAATSLPRGDAVPPKPEHSPYRCETIRGDDSRSVLGNDGQLRMCTLATEGDDGSIMVVQIARNLEPVRATIRSLTLTLLILVVFGLIVAALASWLITGRILVPLKSIADKADNLSITSLDNRLEGGGRDEVSMMASSLNAMLDRLQQSFHAQERFLSAVSHELRTPLAVLLGQAQVLARQSRDPDEYERFLTSVQDEARTLSRTVESLLTLARAEAGFPHASTSPVSINEAVIDAVAKCSPLADQREVILVPELDMPDASHTEPIVSGDDALLGLMVSNLIRNAIKYAPPESSVDVAVSTAEGQVEITVRDRGPGIPDEYIQRVFDRFFQVPEDEASYKGIGIGLTITRGVAEMHGGSVAASNHPEGGCVFRVRIPLAEPPHPSHPVV